MKSTVFVPLALASLAFAETPRDKYKAICPALHDEPGSYDSGSCLVHYTCDKSGKTLLGDPETTESPEDCAILCKATSGCKGSAWLYAKSLCQLFADGEADDEKVLGAVYMRRDSPEVVEPTTPEVNDSDCENALQDCQAEKDNMQDDLDTCNTAKETCEVELAKCGNKEALDECNEQLDQVNAICAADKKNLQKKLDTCLSKKEDPVWLRRKNALEICSYGGRTKIPAGKYSYTTHCGRRAARGQFYSQSALGVDACLAACSKDTKCKAVNYHIMHDAPCKLYTTRSALPLVANEDSECPTWPVIGLVPTTAK